MPLSVRAAVALAALLAGPAAACPGLDAAAAPYVGELTFSLHNGLTNLSMSARAGGLFNLRDCGLEGDGLTQYRGDGLVRLRPNLLMHWQGEAPQLVIGSEFEEDTFLLIHVPEGHWLFDDNGRGHNPLVVLDAPTVGDYAIYLGTHGTTRLSRPGKLIISETRP